MSLELRFFLAAVCVTLGCLLPLTGFGSPLDSVSMLIGLLLSLSPRDYTEPIRFRFRLPRWNPTSFFMGLAILLGLFLLFLLAAQIPDGFFTKWYAAVPLWLLFLSLLAARYAQEKRKQKSARGDSPAAESPDGDAAET